MIVKNILCFGDSNTWGFVPDAYNPRTSYMERYPLSIRWPGVMSRILGDEFHIIEEGLNGRTTNIEYPDLSGRSGTSYIVPCLYSHSPLDIVILQLGINDTKTIFDRNTVDISEGIIEIIDLIMGTLYGKDMQSPPQILLLSPPPLAHEGYIDQDGKLIFEGGRRKSLQFHDHYDQIAKDKGCYYINLSSEVGYSKIDGLHLDEEGHGIVGSITASKVKEIFKL